ncbi:putative ankyrin repeat protein RF_0381 [Cloeon dipterum]|uniref:putative ankyrin repeat protein RF_0381 n=1 Tax=Cloeon dipterum TaxID=197152 RepID=UPI00321FCBEB
MRNEVATPLMLAAKSDDPESCLKELESDADAFEAAKNESEETPLQMALLSGRIDAAENLLKSGANVDLKVNGKNVLHLCVEKNMLSSAQLVHKRSDKQIQERDSTGRKVIHVAAENADLSMCKWLVEKGADVTALCHEKRSSALHRVGLNVKYGSEEELTNFFKTLGFSLEKRDKEDLTPLHYALRAGNLKVASDMVKLGANLRVKSNSLNFLHYCVRHNYLESAKFIHEKDEELIKMVCQSGGRTVLHIAAEFADKEMCRWLVSQGASVSTLSGDAENNVLHFAALNFTHGVALTKFFHDFGIALNERNKFCLSPLHVALECENLKVAYYLLNLDANINLYIDQSNLMHFCATRNKLDAAKLLHERNPELIKGLCFGGRTTLHTAAQFSTVEFCQWLVENGANPKVRDNLGRLAWHYVPHGENELKTYLEQFQI